MSLPWAESGVCPGGPVIRGWRGSSVCPRLLRSVISLVGHVVQVVLVVSSVSRVGIRATYGQHEGPSPDHRDLLRNKRVAQSGWPRVLPGKDSLFSLWQWAWDHLWMPRYPVERNTENKAQGSLERKEVEPWRCFNCYGTSHLKIYHLHWVIWLLPPSLPLLFLRLTWMRSNCRNQKGPDKCLFSSLCHKYFGLCMTPQYCLSLARPPSWVAANILL